MCVYTFRRKNIDTDQEALSCRTSRLDDCVIDARDRADIDMTSRRFLNMKTIRDGKEVTHASPAAREQVLPSPVISRCERVVKATGMNGDRAWRGRLRPMTAWPLSSGHLCAHPRAISFPLRALPSSGLTLSSPIESTAASHIYKGPRGIATLRIITAVTCEPLNLRLSFVTRDLRSKNFNAVSSTISLQHESLLRPPLFVNSILFLLILSFFKFY